MLLSELFVRVTGETSDFTSKMAGAQRSMEHFGSSANKASAASEGHTLALGRVERALGVYVARAVGANQITEALGVAFGGFAVGAEAITGALIVVTAAIGIYNKLTEAARDAVKAQNDAIASLENLGRLKLLGPGGETVDQTQKAKDRAAAIAVQIANMEGMIVKDAQDGDVLASNAIIQAKINKLYIDRQNALNAAATGQSAVNEAVSAATDKVATKVTAVVGKYNELRDAADKVNAAMMKDNKDWWKSYIDSGNEALNIFQQLENAKMSAQPSLIQSLQSLAPPIPTFSMPTIAMPGAGLDDKQKKQLQDLGIDVTGNADKNKDAMVNAILTSASIVVGALNIGGGGKGSSIGSALGGALGGAALGGKLGAFGGPLGWSNVSHHRRSVPTMRGHRPRRKPCAG